MNIGKVIALGAVSAIAINALGYFAMNTGIGYNIIISLYLVVLPLWKFSPLLLL